MIIFSLYFSVLNGATCTTFQPYVACLAVAYLPFILIVYKVKRLSINHGLVLLNLIFVTVAYTVWSPYKTSCQKVLWYREKNLPQEWCSSCSLCILHACATVLKPMQVQLKNCSNKHIILLNLSAIERDIAERLIKIHSPTVGQKLHTESQTDNLT